MEITEKEVSDLSDLVSMLRDGIKGEKANQQAEIIEKIIQHNRAVNESEKEPVARANFQHSLPGGSRALWRCGG